MFKHTNSNLKSVKQACVGVFGLSKRQFSIKSPEHLGFSDMSEQSTSAIKAMSVAFNDEDTTLRLKATGSYKLQLRRARALVIFTKKSAKLAPNRKRVFGSLAFKSWSGSVVGALLLANWGATRADREQSSVGMASSTRYIPHAVRSFISNGPYTTYLHKTRFPRRIKPVHYVPSYPYTKEKYRLLRFRFERWFFNTLGCRTYVWFSDIWLTVSKRVHKPHLEHMYARCMRRLAKKGSRFAIRETQAHVMFQSILLAVTTVTGLQFFMKMVIKMLQSFRSHWAVLLHALSLFHQCKNYFWFKTLYQYRLVVRGKFGGYLRASQQVFQHGVVKLHQWDLNINYYRLCPHTKYGTFSVRFWLQLRDLRRIRYNQMTNSLPFSKLKDVSSKSTMVF